MKWLRRLTLCALILLASGRIVEEFAELPSPANRIHSHAYSDTDATGLGRAIAPRVEMQAGLSGIHTLTEGRGAFATRALLARAAERSIDVQYYLWHHDLTGSLLFEELRAAAERGVRVRLLLDDNGTSGEDATLAALDAHPNIEVRLFNPFMIRTLRLLGYLTDFSRLNRRMHNKSFTVDNQATIVGGRNIGDEYFGAGDGPLFADLDVLAVGPVVGEVSKAFDRYWASASSYPAARILSPASPARLADIASRASLVERDPNARAYVNAIRDLPMVTELAAGSLPFEWAPVRLVTDDPAKGLGRAGPGNLLISKLEELLQPPRRRLGLVSGYFVPTKAGTDAFVAAAKRGVDVNIVTNALEATDVPIVNAGYSKYRKPLLRGGVKLWEIRGPVRGDGAVRKGIGSGSGGGFLGSSSTALHAKTFTIDGERMFVGSFNFDPRSAKLNTELGLVIESPVLAQEMDRRLAKHVPTAAYEVRLSDKGDLYWFERIGDRLVRHDTEPGTSAWDRFAVAFLSLLPIEWLL